MTLQAALQAEARRYLALGPLAPSALVAVLLDRFEGQAATADARFALHALLGTNQAVLTRDLKLELPHEQC